MFEFHPGFDADVHPLPKSSIPAMVEIYLPQKIWLNSKLFHHINKIEDKLSNSCFTYIHIFTFSLSNYRFLILKRRLKVFDQFIASSLFIFLFSFFTFDFLIKKIPKKL